MFTKVGSEYIAMGIAVMFEQVLHRGFEQCIGQHGAKGHVQNLAAVILRKRMERKW